MTVRGDGRGDRKSITASSRRRSRKRRELQYDNEPPATGRLTTTTRSARVGPVEGQKLAAEAGRVPGERVRRNVQVSRDGVCWRDEGVFPGESRPLGFGVRPEGYPQGYAKRTHKLAR